MERGSASSEAAVTSADSQTAGCEVPIACRNVDPATTMIGLTRPDRQLTSKESRLNIVILSNYITESSLEHDENSSAGQGDEPYKRNEQPNKPLDVPYKRGEVPYKCGESVYKRGESVYKHRRSSYKLVLSAYRHGTYA